MNILDELESIKTKTALATPILTGNFDKDLIVTRDDYFILLNILNHYQYSLSEEESTCYLTLKETLDTCRQQGILYKYHPSTIKNLILSTSLLPLVLANRIDSSKVRMTNQNTYLFLCQFHSESNPSLKINDAQNQYYCYGCGKSGNIIEYIKKMENQSYTNAVELLMRIFLLKENDGTKLPDVIEKYQASIVSDEYAEFLKRGQTRIGRYNVKTMPGRSETIEEYYRRKYQMIERIKNQETDSNFECYNVDNFINLNAQELNNNIQKRKKLHQSVITYLPF